MAHSIQNDPGATPAGKFVGEDAFNEANIDERRIIKTITMANIGADASRGVNATADRPVLLCRIAGTARGTVAIEYPLQQPGVPEDKRSKLWLLAGDFEADVYGDDGDTVVRRYAAGFLALPGGFQESVMSRLSAAVEAGLTEAAVNFNWEFAATTSTTPARYRYVARNLDERQEDDGSYLARARARAQKVRALLATPAQPQLTDRR